MRYILLKLLPAEKMGSSLNVYSKQIGSIFKYRIGILYDDVNHSRVETIEIREINY